MLAKVHHRLIDKSARLASTPPLRAAHMPETHVHMKESSFLHDEHHSSEVERLRKELADERELNRNLEVTISDLEKRLDSEESGFALVKKGLLREVEQIRQELDELRRDMLGGHHPSDHPPSQLAPEPLHISRRPRRIEYNH